ncbi:MAG TPA: CocE/NonD family hydrolase [Polyangiaceae bacterium]
MRPATNGFAYAAQRVFRMAFPPVHVTAPRDDVRFDRDVPVRMRDGVTLRANVFRPTGPGRFPVVMSAHPYGKDDLPRRVPFGYLPVARYRFIRQPEPVTFSAYTSWEAPDPCFWVPRGYVVVNLDLRGFGTSEGTGSLFSDQEAEDYAEAIAWAASQPWSTGKVGLNGVSYLAISQWKAAALHPPSLAAICPWEGFSDPYLDVTYPGGVREDGFWPFWATMTEKTGRVTGSMRDGQLAHPDRDAYWQTLTPTLERIEAPALVCASFSDQGLHTRGSFEAFRRMGSRERWLFTHRAGKWSTYYGPEALALQARFFDWFLKGEGEGIAGVPAVRLEVRTSRTEVREVRGEAAWPLPGTNWTKLHLAPGEMRTSAPAEAATVRFAVPDGGVTFDHRIEEDTELAGPMVLVLHAALDGGDDAHLFAAVRKIDGATGKETVFEGSFGFGRDAVARGWLRVAHRRVDEAQSDPWRPFLPCDRAEPLPAGEIARLAIALLPSATSFRRGDVLRVDVRGRWFWKRNPITGIFPADFAPSPAATVVLHTGGACDAHLLVPRTR